MDNLKNVLITRMTHIENIPHILKYGITHKSSPNANPNYKAIGDPSIISTRDLYEILENKTLGDYIPFYFWFRMPMLYVIQKGYNSVKTTNASDIVYCVSKIQNLIVNKVDFIFTNGQANAFISEVYTIDDVDQILNILDYKAIKTDYWIDPSDKDLKRRMEAECLVSQDIHISAVEGFVVFNQEVKDKLLSFGVNLRIEVCPQFYF